MKLKAFRVNPKNFRLVDFTFSLENGREETITLDEKPDWPIILNQPLELVEKWVVREYHDAFVLLAMTGKFDGEIPTIE